MPNTMEEFNSTSLLSCLIFIWSQHIFLGLKEIYLIMAQGFGQVVDFSDSFFL